MSRHQNQIFFTVITVLLVSFFVLKEVFTGHWLINPIAFSFGPVEVRWYGIISAIGIVLALEWTMRRAQSRGLNLTVVERASFAAIVGGIIGARLIYVAQNGSYFSAHVDRILALTDGGLSIHGALLGGAIALFLSLVIQSPRAALATRGSKNLVGLFLQIADVAIPGLLLAMILGRLGNFANAELYGPPTDLPWKLFIPEVSRPAGLSDVAYYHPTFLYDIILNAVVLMLLLRFESRRTFSLSLSPRRRPAIHLRGVPESEKVLSRFQKPGQLTLWFFLGIAVTRFIVEFWRLGDSIALGLSLAQLVSLVVAVGATVVLIAIARSSKSTPST